MQIEDGEAIKIMGAVVTGLCGAVGYLYWHMHAERKKCDKRIHALWLYVCNLLGWETPPDLDEMPPIKAPRSGRLFTTGNHPLRRRSD